MAPFAQTGYQLLDQLAELGWGDDDRRDVAGSYELVAALCGGIERPFGRTFLDHLVGTASIVAAGGGGPALVRASLLHNVLGRQPDAGAVERIRSPYYTRLVRRSAGDEVLGIVQTYAVSRSDRSVSEIASQGGTDVGLLALANTVDDIADGRGAYLPADVRARRIAYSREGAGWARTVGLDELAAIAATASDEAEAVTEVAVGTSAARGLRVLLRFGSGWRNSDPSLTVVLFDRRVRRLIDPFRKRRSPQLPARR